MVRLGAIVCAAAAWTGVLAAAADVRPSWECLPAETAVMVRVPAVREFWETLQKQTKFGSVALRPERLERLWQVLLDAAKDQGDESFEEFQESLRKDGLELTDLATMFNAEMGMGLLALPREGETPVPLFLVWMEPGEETAGKILAAIRRRMEEEDDGDEFGVKRIDLELAGHSVTTFVEPVVEVDVEDFEFETEDGADLDEAAIEAQLDAHLERVKNAPVRQTGELTMYMTSIGGRLLFGISKWSMPAAGEEGMSEEVRRIFATFLEAHARDGEPAMAAVVREPALVAATLPGLSLMEVLVVPTAFMTAAGDAGGVAYAALAKVGLDDLGSLMVRASLDGDRMRSAVALTLPAPRHGVFQLLDQPCDSSEVPAFVTSEVSEFAQLSIDLGVAYRSIRQFVLAQAEGEQAANMFNVADTQSQAWLNADVASVLSGLGSRHWFLTFPPQVAEAMARARAAEENGGDTTPLADRMAIVWQVADDAPYRKLVGRLAQLAGGQLEEEQGFEGVRIPGAAAFYVGRGHLVIAIGEGTVEKTLTAIRTPPKGETSLRESNVPRRAAELVPARPARMYSVSDASRTGGSLGVLRDLAAALEPDDMDEQYRGVFAAFKELLPSAREMEGMFGVGTSLMRMTDDGLLLESAWEMPAP